MSKMSNGIYLLSRNTASLTQLPHLHIVAVKEDHISFEVIKGVELKNSYTTSARSSGFCGHVGSHLSCARRKSLMAARKTRGVQNQLMQSGLAVQKKAYSTRHSTMAFHCHPGTIRWFHPPLR